MHSQLLFMMNNNYVVLLFSYKYLFIFYSHVNSLYVNYLLTRNIFSPTRKLYHQIKESELVLPMPPGSCSTALTQKIYCLNFVSKEVQNFSFFLKRKEKGKRWLLLVKIQEW